MNLASAFLGRFGGILTGLCDALAGRAALAQDPALLMLVWRWVRRLRERAEHLAGRLAQGEVLDPKPAVKRSARADATPTDGLSEDEPFGEQLRTGRPPGPRLPLQWGWIIRQDPETLPFGMELLSLLLRDEEMQDFLTAAPEIVPAVRHLLRLLALCPPDFLARPKRTPTPSARPPRARIGGPRPGRAQRTPAPRPMTGADFFPKRLSLNMLNRPGKPV